MAINDPYAAARVRAPRIKILSAGKPIFGVLSFEIHQNNYHQADTFSAEFAFNADPTTSLSFWGDPAWDTSSPLLLDIQASIDGGDTYTSLILGQVDHATAHIEKGIIQIDGRDLSATLIDLPATGTSFQNQTASQIVQALAGEVGLHSDVTPTTKLVGSYYGTDHNVLFSDFSRSSTAWNLISLLAQQEIFDAYVTGNTLHFHPKTPPTADPFVLALDRTAPSLNALELTAERQFSFAKDVQVVVRSWNSHLGKSLMARSGSGTGNVFSYVFPNLEGQSGVQAEADRIRRELSRHERVIKFATPGDLTLTPRNLVNVVGTDSSWDQNYIVDSVTKSLSFDAGFVQHVQAKSFTSASS